MPDFDTVIIGAGIAGASLAWELSRIRRVALIERETFGGTQSTGRSAALYIYPYGTPTMSALARASLPFLLTPPDDFADVPLLSSRPTLWLARADQVETFDAIATRLAVAGNGLTAFDAAAAVARWPILNEGYLGGGKAMLDEGSFDIDVHALYSSYIRGFRARGGTLWTDAAVSACRRDGYSWLVQAGHREIRAGVVVNAAGAWADEVASFAGAAPVGLVAKRRTMVMLPPLGVKGGDWPCFVDTDDQFYFKPEGESLLVSPADETPVAPSDVQPDEYDVAIAVDRLQTATNVEVRAIARKWAGLRTFAADGDPVIGWDRSVPGFFWLAGQGGAGIMTSPAIARLAASLVTRTPVPADLADIVGRAERINPARFQR